VVLFSISVAALSSCSGDDAADSNKDMSERDEDAPGDGANDSKGTKASGAEKAETSGTRVQKGERPPVAEPLQPGKMDGYRNALGGVRIQDIEVPIATTYSLDGAAAADRFDFLSLFVCGAGGSTTPFTETQLLKLYPTHDDYFKKYSEAADKALDGGFLLKADYDSAIKWAKSAPIPN
jgi:hypothetical protein